MTIRHVPVLDCYALDIKEKTIHVWNKSQVQRVVRRLKSKENMTITAFLYPEGYDDFVKAKISFQVHGRRGGEMVITDVACSVENCYEDEIRDEIRKHFKGQVSFE